MKLVRFEREYFDIEQKGRIVFLHNIRGKEIKDTSRDSELSLQVKIS
jgi:hypothetical protein